MPRIARAFTKDAQLVIVHGGRQYDFGVVTDILKIAEYCTDLAISPALYSHSKSIASLEDRELILVVGLP